MIEYLKKDVTSVDLGIVAHGVNCQHAMGSGVAGAIRAKWPIVYNKYIRQPKGRAMLGVCHMIRINEGRDDLFVANCYTQNLYGYGGGPYADIHSIICALDSLGRQAYFLDLPVFIPPIGCGLGGLSWEKDVHPILVQTAEKYDRVNFYACDKDKPPMLNENQQELKFIVKVNGQIRTAPLLRMLAEAAVQNLPEHERAIATLVPATEDGQELLLET